MNILPKLLIIINLLQSFAYANQNLTSKLNVMRNANKISPVNNRISKLRLILLSDLKQNEIIVRRNMYFIVVPFIIVDSVVLDDDFFLWYLKVYFCCCCSCHDFGLFHGEQKLEKRNCERKTCETKRVIISISAIN